KLAAGHLDLHSRHSSIDLPLLAQWAADVGGSDALQAEIRAANTSQEALALASKQGVPLGDAVCRHARDVASGIVPPEVTVEVFAIDREGRFVGVAQ
ncbi:MAG: cobalt-precorrin-5B (C(1))-methyltransferase, partial [Trinickia sp.]